MRNKSPALTSLGEKLSGQPGTLILPWPDREQVYNFRTFANFDEWFTTISALNLNSKTPDVLAHRYARAQKIFLTAWLEPDLIKAGELVAFTALEYAVVDRYGHKIPVRKKKQKSAGPWDAQPPSFGALLNYMVKQDDLADEKLPFIQKYGGSVVGRLAFDSDVKPSLPDIRNTLAHGNLFEGLPGCGLLELIRDLIDYAYRDWPEPSI